MTLCIIFTFVCFVYLLITKNRKALAHMHGSDREKFYHPFFLLFTKMTWKYFSGARDIFFGRVTEYFKGGSRLQRIEYNIFHGHPNPLLRR